MAEKDTNIDIIIKNAGGKKSGSIEDIIKHREPELATVNIAAPLAIGRELIKWIAEKNMSPKMGKIPFARAANTTIAPFALQKAEHELKQAKEKINGVMSEINYPEGLITETINGVLRKY